MLQMILTSKCHNDLYIKITSSVPETKQVTMHPNSCSLNFLWKLFLIMVEGYTAASTLVSRQVWAKISNIKLSECDLGTHALTEYTSQANSNMTWCIITKQVWLFCLKYKTHMLNNVYYDNYKSMFNVAICFLLHYKAGGIELYDVESISIHV